ncbi:MAG: ABC transporter permease [Acidobacteriota bacterium]
MTNLVQDLRFSVRGLARRPGITIVAVLTLALGIGVNAAVFSVVRGVLLRPLPYADSERILAVWEYGPSQNSSRSPASPANYVDWRDQSRSFQYLAARSGWNALVTGEQGPEMLTGALVTSDFFPLMGVQAHLGRTFSAQEGQRGHEPVVVLSHSLWNRRFGGDESVVGRRISIYGDSHTIIGVAPPGFNFPYQAQIWGALVLDGNLVQVRGGRFLQVYAKLHPDVALDQAQTEMRGLAERLSQQHPKTNSGWSVELVRLQDQIVGDARLSLLVLMGAVVFVLLIACTNVASLLLARGEGRRVEVALRAGLGASRGRLVRMFLSESLLLTLSGAVLGAALAYGAVRLLLFLDPSQIPRLDEVAVDWPVLGFAMALSLVAGSLAGLVPTLKASKPNLLESLQEGDKGFGGLGRQRFRQTLVACEIALALMLLIGAGLMVKSFSRLLNVDLGFDPSRVLTMTLSLHSPNYPDDVQRRAFFDRLQQRVESLPGVLSAGWTTFLPLSGASMEMPVSVEGPPVDEQDRPRAQYRHISRSYLRTMGIELRNGRDFNLYDSAESPSVIIVNKAFAQRFFPNESALGKQVGFGSGPDWREVVGVVEDIRHFGPDSPAAPEAYVPISQETWARMTLVVQAASEAKGLSDVIRNTVLEIDKNQPVYNIKTMEELLSRSLASQRFVMLLLSVFAALALVLTLVGIYGVMAYMVSQRTREIGIRMALGARPRDVLRLVIGQGAKLALLAAAAGLIGAVALTRFLSGLLHDVHALDPTVFCGLFLMVIGVVLAACYLPAHRAAAINPLSALRRE